MDNSDTPRTDAASCINPSTTFRKIYAREVPADFARQLERELNEARAALREGEANARRWRELYMQRDWE